MVGQRRGKRARAHERVHIKIVAAIVSLVAVASAANVALGMYDEDAENPVEFEQPTVEVETFETAEIAMVEVEAKTEVVQIEEPEIEIAPEEEDNTETVVEEEEKPFFELSDKERAIAEKIVMGESGGESFKGQMLVAQCILNACILDGLQPSEVRVEYKYSGWKENPTESVKEAVAAVFDRGETVVDEPILYFYAPKRAQGKFHETQIHVVTEGGHKFFMEREE